MIINNALIDGRIRSAVIEDGLISSISDSPRDGGIDARGLELIPGLIDIHTHGCMGHDVMDADLGALCALYAERGTTTFLPTTMTSDRGSLARVTSQKTDFKGANVPGFHLEGPFISQKRKGAQNGDLIREPSLSELSGYKNVRMITLAPELDGAMELISAVTPGIIVSIGHTDCGCDAALEAIDRGASCLTHTFNAMPPLLHRAPGPIGAAVERYIYAQIICDGIHVAAPAVIAAWRMFGSDRMILISDSLACAGLDDGEYESGGLPVVLRDGAAYLRDGTLAGSGSMLIDCVKKAVSFGIPKQDAIRMATRTPAELLGLNKGRVEPGYDADLLLVDRDLNIHAVIIGGELFCGS